MKIDLNDANHLAIAVTLTAVFALAMTGLDSLNNHGRLTAKMDQADEKARKADLDIAIAKDALEDAFFASDLYRQRLAELDAKSRSPLADFRFFRYRGIGMVAAEYHRLWVLGSAWSRYSGPLPRVYRMIGSRVVAVDWLWFHTQWAVAD